MQGRNDRPGDKERSVKNKTSLRKNRLTPAMAALLLIALFGLHCGQAGEAGKGTADTGNDPVLKLLSERAKFQVQLKSCADMRNQWEEKEGVILSVSVVNDSKITLPKLTVSLRRYAPGKEDVPLESKRLTMDVRGIAPNRGSEIMVQVPGFLPGPMDLLSVELEALPAEEEYGEFPELADALAARMPSD